MHKQMRCLEQKNRNKRKQIQASKETHRESTATEGRVTSIGREKHCFIGRYIREGRREVAQMYCKQVVGG
jgi:hypothetical protein